MANFLPEKFFSMSHLQLPWDYTYQTILKFKPEKAEVRTITYKTACTAAKK